MDHDGRGITICDEVGAASCTGSHKDDNRRKEIRKLHAERNLEKDTVKRKFLSIALFRARQKTRRAQDIRRCIVASQLGAPSRLNASPWKTNAPVLEKVGEDGNTEKVEELSGRTDIVRRHFCDLFTDTIDEFLSKGIEQRWPREILEALPKVDAERVRKITWTFRKKTSSADDHVVIEMLRELEMDFFVRRLRSFSSSDC